MALETGTRFGPYEVTGQIGAGGMGEVYRATDTKLGRDVAVKTLPAALATDTDRLARFEREAKLLAALNHPHIASVFSLDEHDGTLYLAMELVEGETLEDRLRSGALPVEEALRLALQIAEALEAAHGKGVIHRDLKPANIMLTREGQVKVLDFGLAKAFSNEPEEASPGRSPALSLAMTQQGIILGTAGYMSPEQASGQAADQRADVWAFGVVLYEMLTGLPLFSGESVPHILAAVLQIEPDWNRLPDDLHPRIRQLLERCLRKKPRVRYQSIGDVRVDIEEILSDPAGTAPAAALPGQASLPASRLGRFGLPLTTLVAGAAVAGVAVWLAMLPEPLPEPEPQPVNRFDYDVPEDTVFRRTGRPVMALARNGRAFVFNTSDGLYIRRMGELAATLIPGTEEDLSNPFFSPDGQSVAYYAFDGGQLKRISVSGGAPVVIASDLDNPIGASWEADGTMLVAQEQGIFRVAASGGTPELVIAAGEGERLQGPQLLPDGDSVLFSADLTNNWDTAEIVAASLSTGERSVVHRGGSDARYLPSGHLVYAYEDNLFGVVFDIDTLTVSGGPVPLVQGLSRATGGGSDTPSANYGISDDGTLTYLSTAAFGGGQRSLVWVGRDGSETAVAMPPCDCASNMLALSPDDTRAALSIRDPDRGGQDIWIWSFGAETLMRLTFEDGNQLSPIWTSDGLRIVYGSTGAGLLARAADGTGTVETLLAESASVPLPRGLDSDGNVIFDLNNGIHVLNVAGGGEAEPLIDSQFDDFQSVLSPDGRWIAYGSDESGRPEIYVRPYPAVDSGRWQVSSGGGLIPKWSADGSRLTFISQTTLELVEAEVETEPTFSWRTPQPLFPFNAYRAYQPTAEGERFLVVKLGDANDTVDAHQARVIVVQNWVEELARLVPTD